MRPEDLVRPEILALKAYPVPSSDGMVKLDAMENPYPLPDSVKRELAAALARVDMNRYPTPSPRNLREAIVRRMNVPAGMEVLLGNGSDELIQMLITALARPGAALMYPSPTFVMYSMGATFSGMRAVAVPLREDFSLDADAFIARMQAEKPALVFLAYPNNPTGVLYPEPDVVKIIRACKGLVVMDEAYQPFASRDSLHRLERHAHVLLMRTMSKFGLAGLRVGYLIGRREVIAEIEKLRPPFNVGVLNAEAALFALEHEAEYRRQAAVIRAEREGLQQALKALPGVTPFPSEANMILARVPDAKRAFEGMKARGVLVKNIATLHPLLANCLRLTVGTPDENTQMIAALKASL